jgi:hypothetical protein
MVYGPNYDLRPPFPPFNGLLPPNPGAAGAGAGAGAGNVFTTPVFPTHPYARSPRDYFMVEW